MEFDKVKYSPGDTLSSDWLNQLQDAVVETATTVEKVNTTANEAVETANAAATTAANALKVANSAGSKSGISREFNITAKSTDNKTSMSFATNYAWFYIIEVGDKTGTSSVYSRQTMTLDYYSLISGNTYEFACGAKICGELSGTKVTVLLLNSSDTNYRLTRFTGYI